MNLASIIGNVVGAVREVFGWKREQAARTNTPEMQANAKAADDAKVVDEARRDIAKGDTDDIRKGLS